MLSTFNTQITQEGANAMLAAWAALLDSGSSAGTLAIYAGDIPASAATAITTQTLLGTLTLGDPAFGSASGGTLTANEITGDTAADASGTASFARLRDSNGTTRCDIKAGVAGSGAGLELATTTIVAGVAIEVTSLTINMPLGS